MRDHSNLLINILRFYGIHIFILQMPISDKHLNDDSVKYGELSGGIKFKNVSK